jgi:hypothetical protein
VICAALKRYGMFVADNGSSWYLSGAPDQGWDDDTLVDELKQISGSDFEAIDESALQIAPGSAQARQQAQDSMSVAPAGARQGQLATYTIQIAGDGTPTGLNNQLPADVTRVAGPTTTPSGVAGAMYNGATRTITWNAAPASTVVVSISYTVSVDTAATGLIVNNATITRSSGVRQLLALLISNPRQSFLPLVRR